MHRHRPGHGILAGDMSTSRATLAPHLVYVAVRIRCAVVQPAGHLRGQQVAAHGGRKLQRSVVGRKVLEAKQVTAATGGSKQHASRMDQLPPNSHSHRMTNDLTAEDSTWTAVS